MRADAEDSSSRLRDVIRSIRSCKTTAEERTVISAESARIRAAFRNEFSENRHRNVAKLIFFHMLGYSTSFAHMECLKLIVSKKFGEKKIGYLALTQIMGEDDPLTLMATSSIKSDLASTKPAIVQTALSAIANTASADMCRELATDVLALLGRSRSSIMPRATLAACRIIRKCPELVDDFTPLATTFVDERSTQLLGCGLSLILTILRSDPSKAAHFANFSTSLQTTLKELVMRDSSEELDINNITDPFTQCRLLEVLRLTGKAVPTDREGLEVTLAYVLTSTEFTKQTGRCVIYECCRTILDIDATKQLREQAISMLGKLLTSRENNTRFIALKGIAKEVDISQSLVSSFRMSVLECIQDLDCAVSRRALDLLVQITTPASVSQVTSDLLSLLVTAETEMKESIARKTCILAEMYAADQRSYIDTMVRVLSLAGNYIDEDTVARTANTILGCAQLRQYATKMLFFSAKDNLAQEGLVTLALWCIGEYADLLVVHSESVALPSPAPSEVVELVSDILKRDSATSTKLYALTTLLKLSTRLPSELVSIRYQLEPLTLSPLLEIQQRACEYSAILADEFQSDRQRLLQSSPPYDKEQRASVSAAPMGGSGEGVALGPTLVDEFTEQPLVEGEGKRNWGENLLEIGEDSGNNSAPSVDFFAPTTTSLHNIDFGFFPPATSTEVPLKDDGEGATNLLPDLFSAPSASVPAVASANADPSDDFSEVPYLELTAYSDSAVRVTMTCSKDDPSDPSHATINVTSFALQATITDFSLNVSGNEYIAVAAEPTKGHLSEVGTSLTQTLEIHNSAQGQKHICLALEVKYTLNGVAYQTSTTMSSFPDPF